jgi:hypothetical protein
MKKSKSANPRPFIRQKYCLIGAITLRRREKLERGIYAERVEDRG